jgi:DNA gyrase subunit A
LLNGSEGIAVGMATNIPPHNLGEVVDATIAVLKDPEIDIEDLLQIVKGPDFPTSGLICGREELTDSDRTGRGIARSRAEPDRSRGVSERKNRGLRRGIRDFK